MRKIRLTAKHFNWFKESVHYWARQFGLQGWDIRFESAPSEAYLAEVNYNVRTRKVYFKLSTQWEDAVTVPTRRLIEETALHEVLHLCFADLTEVSQSRESALSHEEDVVHRLSAVILAAKDRRA